MTALRPRCIVSVASPNLAEVMRDRYVRLTLTNGLQDGGFRFRRAFAVWEGGRRAERLRAIGPSAS